MNESIFKKQITKTLTIKENGRSSNYITPNFVLGCGSFCTYCYVDRFGRNKIYFNENIDEILNKILIHSQKLGNKTPEQTDDKYWTYDIGCDTDVSVFYNKYNFSKVFKFFTETPNIKATFATKFVNYNLLKYGNEKLRIRFSLIPQNIADLVEKDTSSIKTRIEAIDRFIDAGWDVHLNFSPVIYYPKWMEDYKLLFEEINNKVKHKNKLKCEVIFLTHNQNLHQINLNKGYTEAEKLLWAPEIQENKISQYGGSNVRYEHKLKYKLVQEFTNLINNNLKIPIRYIF